MENHPLPSSAEQEQAAEKEKAGHHIVRSKQEEYRLISDLTGFDNITAMLVAEALIKSRKQSKKKKKKKRKKSRYIEFIAQGATSLDTAVEKEQAKTEVEMPKALPAADLISSDIAIGTSLFSSGGNGGDVVILSTSFSGSMTEMEPKERITIKEMKPESIKEENNDKVEVSLIQVDRSKEEKHMGKAMEPKPVKMIDNSLLHQPLDTRYSDPPSVSWDRCPSCRQECTMRKRKKPCFFCGSLEHNWRHCMQVNNALGVRQACKDGGVQTESAQARKTCVPQKPVVDAAMGKEPANKKVIMIKALTAADQINSAIVSNCSSFTLEGGGMISSMNFCGTMTEMAPAQSFKTKEMNHKGRKNENVDRAEEVQREDTSRGMETESAEMMDNIVLRRLLRASRYFDPPIVSWDRCDSCGQEGHKTRRCRMRKRKKQCLFCGSLDHKWRHCVQNQHCFVCKGRGHGPNYYQENNQENNSNLKICLRCGDSGHSMFECGNDYSPDDLQQIQCYVCKSFGHLCCGDFPNMGLRELSCYNCGESGHLGTSCGEAKWFKAINP